MFDISLTHPDCIWTLAAPTWKLSCCEYLRLVGYTSRLVLYCYHLLPSTKHYLFNRENGNKGRRMRKIEQGHCGRYSGEETEAREREEEAQGQWEEEARREEARMEETHSQEEGVAEKRPKTEKSDTETEAGGEAGTSL